MTTSEERILELTIEIEQERIAKAGAAFFQEGDFDNWLSPTGRRFEDLGNGWRVGYDMMKRIIDGEKKAFSYEI